LTYYIKYVLNIIILRVQPNKGYPLNLNLILIFHNYLILIDVIDDNFLTGLSL